MGLSQLNFAGLNKGGIMPDKEIMPNNFILRISRNGRGWKRKQTNKLSEEVYDVELNGKKFHRGICVKWFYILTGIRLHKGQSFYFNCYGKDDTVPPVTLHWSEQINTGDRK